MAFTIQDAKTAKEALEETIAHALQKFSRDTSMTVTDILIERNYVMGKPEYLVKLDVTL